MKILFYGTKEYDKQSFSQYSKVKGITINFIESELDLNTAHLSKGYDAICIFVNNTADEKIIKILNTYKIRLILLRCAGYNNVDINACNKYKITVLRVPGYSPQAVAEMSMALALAVNRKIHKAYIKVRENNFSLTGLLGMNFYEKTAGIIGTGKIGIAMANICLGFGMKVLAYDKFPNKNVKGIKYVDLNTLLKESDLISLHCPLTKETYHMINTKTINLMKNNVVLINTSRGGLIKTDDLINAIMSKKFFGVGLDVYEEENEYVFENFEGDILNTNVASTLLSFPNVIVTSHQGFFTTEAINAIAKTTIENAIAFNKNKIDPKNLVK